MSPSPYPHLNASNSVKHEYTLKLQLIVCNMKYPGTQLCAHQGAVAVVWPTINFTLRCRLSSGLTADNSTTADLRVCASFSPKYGELLETSHVQAQAAQAPTV